MRRLVFSTKLPLQSCGGPYILVTNPVNFLKPFLDNFLFADQPVTAPFLDTRASLSTYAGRAPNWLPHNDAAGLGIGIAITGQKQTTTVCYAFPELERRTAKRCQPVWFIITEHRDWCLRNCVGKLLPVEAHFIQSDFGPTGLGEPPMPPFAPAMGNAIFPATGERLRVMWFGRPGYTI